LMYVADSRDMGLPLVSLVGPCLKKPDNNNNKPGVKRAF
jgi:hypothetical protein